jgi:hypothetical protein
MMMILCHTRQIRMISEYEIGPFMTTFVFWFAASVLLLVQELHSISSTYKMPYCAFLMNLFHIIVEFLCD